MHNVARIRYLARVAVWSRLYIPRRDTSQRGELGAFSIERILQSQHFEGFVLLIGLALIAQGMLTLVVVPRLHSTQVP